MDAVCGTCADLSREKHVAEGVSDPEVRVAVRILIEQRIEVGLGGCGYRRIAQDYVFGTSQAHLDPVTEQHKDIAVGDEISVPAYRNPWARHSFRGTGYVGTFDEIRIGI